MEYTIGFKIDETIKTFNLHTLVLTPDKKIGIIDYEPNKNAEKIKVRMSLTTEGEKNYDYYTYEKNILTVVLPFILDGDCKEYTIKNVDKYIIFKNKNERFKDGDLEIIDNMVSHIPNDKNYENPTLEQSILYLKELYRFSSTTEAYAINTLIDEIYKLKYGIDK